MSRDKILDIAGTQSILRIQVVMKRHPSLGNVGCVDFRIFEEKLRRGIMEESYFLHLILKMIFQGQKFGYW
jgi:hypothetical protein